MAAPNTALRAVRLGMRMSQDEFAHALQEAGRLMRQPNDANKRLVQRWESGQILAPRPAYMRALEAVTGLPITALGFTDGVPHGEVAADGRGGHDMHLPSDANLRGAMAAGSASSANYSGVWLSRYEYFSSGRDGSFVGRHYVMLLQHDRRLTVQSLPGSADSKVTMDLTVDGNVVTGTWVEQTERDGYYRGARYHGAIQMLAEPTGRRMNGKWIGFGKDGEVNTGPWDLIFQDAGTDKATVERFNQPPEDK